MSSPFRFSLAQRARQIWSDITRATGLSATAQNNNVVDPPESEPGRPVAERKSNGPEERQNQQQQNRHKEDRSKAAGVRDRRRRHGDHRARPAVRPALARDGGLFQEMRG